MPVDPAALADRLMTQPGLCVELVGRLNLIAGLPATPQTAASVTDWAGKFLEAIGSAPDPVPIPPPPQPPPVTPSGRPAITVTPDPASRYEFWAVAPACEPLARSVGFLTDIDAGYVHDTASIHGGRLAELVRVAIVGGVDVLFTVPTTA